MVDLKVNLSGLELDNPIIPASGTFGYGHDFAELYDINILGSFSFKGTTKDERFGNPTPRIAECEAGMINSVGLQNPGVDAVIADELPKLEKVFNKKVIANVGGFSIDEYVHTCALLDKEEQVGIIEVNISCPNVHGGGMSFGTNASDAAKVTEAVKKVTTKPVYIKLSPNVTDITEIAKACEAAGADGISLINTLLGMRIDLKTKKPVIANKMGGFSGKAIFPVALRMVYQVYEAVSVPIIGMGGVSSADDVIEMMRSEDIANRIVAAFDEVLSWAKNDKMCNPEFKHEVQTVQLARRMFPKELVEEEKKTHEKVMKQKYLEKGDKWDQLRNNSSLRSRRNRVGSVLERYEIQAREPGITTDIHVVRIGDLAFATNRFEMFIDYMHRIQGRSPFGQTVIVQLVTDLNGQGKYLATERGIANKGYSATPYCNVVSAEGGQQLVDKTVDMLKKIKQENGK